MTGAAKVKQLSIIVRGAGILGLWQAYALLRGGHRVLLHDTEPDPFTSNASRLAGAMIAPECEVEGAPDVVRDKGREGLALWRRFYPGTKDNGTLVVALARDTRELDRFARMTQGHAAMDAKRLAALEPALAGRFGSGLYFVDEAHVEAPLAMHWLLDEIRRLGGGVRFGVPVLADEGDVEIDCRGMAAAADLAGLRGVRGERLLIETRDVALTRPVRLLHPRQPIYVVPQSQGRFIVGATVIEREDNLPVTVKSALDLLSAAYALHPGFGEAQIIEMAAGVRPAFPDNVPAIIVANGGRTLRINGAYRHGFLLAPVLADAAAGFLSGGRRDGPFFRDG